MQAKTIIIRQNSSEYPKKLAKLKDPPKQIYCKGNTTLLNSKKIIGIVGSRHASYYSNKVLSYFFKTFQNYPIVTVSGFMVGVDLMCHRFSFDFKIPTLAVIACGIDYRFTGDYFDQSQKLLLEKGLFVSETPDTTPAQKFSFVKRNRIVAALCDVLLVVEAGENSGSLITASLALDLNKPVGVVPGDIFRDLSLGLNKLLDLDNQNIFSAVSAKLILKKLGFKDSIIEDNKSVKSKNLDPVQQRLLEEVKNGAFDINIFSRKTNQNVQFIGQQLSMMELRNLIVMRGGRYYVR